MNEQDERAQRDRYRELLEELRTIIPGAQVLFAFLLTAPFAARFGGIDALGKMVFLVSLLSVAAATVLFLAPAAYHRLAAHHDRAGRLRFGVRTTLAGLFLLALSIGCAIFVVIRFLFDTPIPALLIAVAMGLLVTLLWYVIPVWGRKRKVGSE